MLPRLQLFEIEDQAWCPGWLRDTMTGYLRTVNRILCPYRSAAEPLAQLVQSSGDNRVLDLCSGAGGPWPELAQEMERAGCPVEVTCTDLFPNRSAELDQGESTKVQWHLESVDAMNVPAELAGTRTLFTALHHFEPEEVVALLRDASDAGRHFAAFEITHRSLKGLLATAMIPIMALFLLPRVRPRRFFPLLLSYLPPIVPLAIAWDGMVSTLRSYRAEELQHMVQQLEADGYEWQVLELPSGTPLPMTCVFGRPSDALATL